MKQEDHAALERRIRTYWDERSNAFAVLRGRELNGPNAKAWQDYFTAKLPRPGRPLKILDAGTGTGFLAILLARLGHEVTGIDLAGKMLAEARRQSTACGLKINFLQSCAGRLPFPDGSFDVVVSRNLTWTLPDLALAYREWYRVLTADGMLWNFDCNYGEAEFSSGTTAQAVHADVSSQLLAECTSIKDALPVSRENRPDYDIQLLRSAGFSVVCYADIRKYVQVDPEIQYDDYPFFALRGTK